MASQLFPGSVKRSHDLNFFGSSPVDDDFFASILYSGGVGDEEWAPSCNLRCHFLLLDKRWGTTALPDPTPQMTILGTDLHFFRSESSYKALSYPVYTFIHLSTHLFSHLRAIHPYVSNFRFHQSIRRNFIYPSTHQPILPPFVWSPHLGSTHSPTHLPNLFTHLIVHPSAILCFHIS